MANKIELKTDRYTLTGIVESNWFYISKLYNMPDSRDSINIVLMFRRDEGIDFLKHLLLSLEEKE